MKRTIRDVVVRYRHGVIPYEVTVPKGTPVRPAGFWVEGKPAYWAENLGSFLNRNSIEMHDATHYGLVIPEDEVEEVA